MHSCEGITCCSGGSWSCISHLCCQAPGSQCVLHDHKSPCMLCQVPGSKYVLHNNQACCMILTIGLGCKQERVVSWLWSTQCRRAAALKASKTLKIWHQLFQLSNSLCADQKWSYHYERATICDTTTAYSDCCDRCFFAECSLNVLSVSVCPCVTSRCFMSWRKQLIR